MSEYTSEQYKYLLLRHLQRHFSFEVESYRYYTLAFYQKLLEDIELTQYTYENFLKLLSLYMKYCADNDIYELGAFEDDDAEKNYDSLKDAFQKVGIDFSYLHDGNGNVHLYFTKPNGVILDYLCEYGGTNEFCVNAKCGQEYSYAQQSLPYYQLKNIDALLLEDINCRKAGTDCYWSYNKDTATMTISGMGTYVGATTDEQIGSGTYTTLIIGGNVERLKSSEAKNNASLTTVVLLHAADFPLVIDDFSYGTQSSISQKARTWDVYTDNEVFRNTTFPTKLTINWHSLSEWQG